MLRWLSWFHRWAGVVLCLLFTVWFASGAVLMFVPFPALPDAARREAAEPIALDAMAVTPAAALAQAPDATDLRLVSADGHPRYLLQVPGRPDVAVAGDAAPPPNPLPPGPLTPSQAAAIAGRFAGDAVDHVEGPLAYDQWVVHHRFNRYRPFYRVVLADTAHTWLYVSATTGEVLQRATRAERAWNWCGAVLHWVYFTPIRQDWSLWNQVVWWISLWALLTTIAGIWLGIYRTMKARASRRRALTPFRGWLGWHHLLGLGAGLFVFTWILSGWLSMDHGRLFSTGEAGDDRRAAFQGLTLEAAVAALTLDDLRALGSATELRFGAVAGHPVITAYGGGAPPRTMIPGGGPSLFLPDEVLAAGLRNAWPGTAVSAAGSVDATDLYALAEGMTTDTRRFAIKGAKPVDVYVDGHAGRILVVMDDSRSTYAWVYFALHTFNFPGLTGRPMLRWTLELQPLTLGLVFSLTGVVVSTRRLRRQFPARSADSPKKKARLRGSGGPS
ncbi:PepSY domain-containing protein [Nitrospirillum iridis]|uniref:PepSY domain-containing protein n=1 Tax=Nitrospirillum iridis TaxID=765888 RepID=A0A7X0B2Q1_9PROT|nr:hypothetical protein [Nitrospirillum iridis]